MKRQFQSSLWYILRNLDYLCGILNILHFKTTYSYKVVLRARKMTLRKGQTWKLVAFVFFSGVWCTRLRSSVSELNFWKKSLQLNVRLAILLGGGRFFQFLYVELGDRSKSWDIRVLDLVFCKSSRLEARSPSCYIRALDLGFSLCRWFSSFSSFEFRLNDVLFTH